MELSLRWRVAAAAGEVEEEEALLLFWVVLERVVKWEVGRIIRRCPRRRRLSGQKRLEREHRLPTY